MTAGIEPCSETSLLHDRLLCWMLIMTEALFLQEMYQIINMTKSAISNIMKKFFLATITNGAEKDCQHDRNF